MTARLVMAECLLEVEHGLEAIANPHPWDLEDFGPGALIEQAGDTLRHVDHLQLLRQAMAVEVAQAVGQAEMGNLTGVLLCLRSLAEVLAEPAHAGCRHTGKAAA